MSIVIFPEIALIIVALLVLAFEVAMFIGMLKNEHLTQNSKIIWACAMLLFHPFVAIYYYFTAHNS
jgi:hypothetical protein